MQIKSFVHLLVVHVRIDNFYSIANGLPFFDVSIDKVYLGKGTDDRIPDAEEGDEGKVLTVTEAPDTFEWVESEE